MSGDELLAGVEWPEPVEVPDLSADQRRTLRQRRLVEAGLNPLRGTLHPFAAPEVCSPDAPKGQPFTCGSCRFREAVEYHGRSYPKCTADWWVDGQPGPHVSHGAGTDVRAWWPACDRYQAGDAGLSRDAARSIPGGAS